MKSCKDCRWWNQAAAAEERFPADCGYCENSDQASHLADNHLGLPANRAKVTRPPYVCEGWEAELSA